VFGSSLWQNIKKTRHRNEKDITHRSNREKSIKKAEAAEHISDGRGHVPDHEAGYEEALAAIIVSLSF
jgi:hypothetical protein